MFSSIGDALAAADDGDEILVWPGEYREALHLDKSLAVVGDGPSTSIVIRPPTADKPCISVELAAPRLSNLTVDGTEFDDNLDYEAPVLLDVRSGAPTVESVRFIGHGGIEIGGPGTAGAILGCTIEGSGVAANDGASPRIEDNAISAVWDGVATRGVGTNPIVRGNRLHECGRSGIAVYHGASPSIEDNDIWRSGHVGIDVAWEGTNPLIRGNRIHDGTNAGIWVQFGASPRIEDNDISGPTRFLPTDFDWGYPNIWLSGAGTNPLVRGNRVHDSFGAGVWVVSGASPTIENNEVWANIGPGIDVTGAGTAPRLEANRIHDGQGAGIEVSDGALPWIEKNEIWANSESGIRVAGESSNPTIRGNRIRDSKPAGIQTVGGAFPLIEDNVITSSVVGIAIGEAGTNPTVRGNRVSNAQFAGLMVHDGASGVVEDNELHENPRMGAFVVGLASSPTLNRNRIRDGGGDGIAVSGGASPKIFDNVIVGNAGQAIRLDDDARATVGTNTITR
jgi:F-box protein 11